MAFTTDAMQQGTTNTNATLTKHVLVTEERNNTFVCELNFLPENPLKWLSL